MKVPPYPQCFREIHAATGIELPELLLELIDAVSHPLFEGTILDDHVQVIEVASAIARDFDTQLSDVLLSTKSVIESVAALNEAEVALYGPPANWSAVKEDRKNKRDEWSDVNYVFHGTIMGRVRSIAKHGLIPAKESVWSKGTLARWSARAVFFSSTCRAASDWAAVAHEHSRGPRDGKRRKPVVVRVPTADLALEPDIVTMRPESLVVRGIVKADDAEVLSLGTTSFPICRSIAASNSKD
jgi:hypothetical protein